MKDFINYAAKAVAAFITPFILLFVLWMAKKTGVSIPLQFDDVSTYVVTIVTAVLQSVWVYFQKNAPKPPQVAKPADKGELVLGGWVWIVLIIVAFMLGYLWAGR
jgi:hypothetical protein